MSIFDQADPVIAQLRDELKNLNINNLSPMEALIKLSEWKEQLK
jgi:DNA mismatch repair protein MutS